MRNLQKPTDKVEDIIKTCVSNMREVNRGKYLDAIVTIENYTNEFDEKMKDNKAHLLTQHIKVCGELGKDDMVKLYDNKFAKGGQPGRKYYDSIKLSARNGICPLCGSRDVATLDHFMAKASYPSLAVSPCNLIPACRDCNENKHTDIFNRAEDTIIHPYYDDVQTSEWLFARVVKTKPVCVEYYVNHDNVDDLMYNRLQSHLNALGLKSHYAKKAVEEIETCRRMYQMLLYEGGVEELQKHLKWQYISALEAEKNSWKTALYRALTEDCLTVLNN